MTAPCQVVGLTFQLTDLTGVAGEVDFHITARLAGDLPAVSEGGDGGGSGAIPRLKVVLRVVVEVAAETDQLPLPLTGRPDGRQQTCVGRRRGH